MIKEDEVLVKGLKRGLRSSQERFYKHYYNQVYYQCLKVLWDKQDAEEATQTALFKAMTKIKKFNGSCKLDSWVYRIAQNESLMILRKRDKHLIKEANAKELAIVSYDLSQDFFLRKRIIKAINSLSKPHLEALKLKVINGYENKKAAKRINLSLSAYKSRISRAKRELQLAIGY